MLNVIAFTWNRSYYTRRKFRPIYAKVMNSYVNTHRKSSAFQRHSGANSMSLVTGLLPFTSEMALFEFPFNELLVSNLEEVGHHHQRNAHKLMSVAYQLGIHIHYIDLGGFDQKTRDVCANVGARRRVAGQITCGMQTV